MTLPCLLLALLGAQSPPPGAFAGHDSLSRNIVLAPAESLRVTAVGPVDGAPVIIIPGLVSPAYAFRHLLPALSERGVRAVVIEPLGVGQSSRPGNADYSITAQAARIAAVMDTLGLHHAVVMGQAVGAGMSLRLALARPDLVGRLLLVEGGVVESAAVPGVKSALKFAFLIRIFAGRGRVKKELRKGLMNSSVDTAWVTDSVIDGYTQGGAGDIGAVLRALKGMQKSVEPDSLMPRLGEIHNPVRLLVGGGDRRGGTRGISPGPIRNMQSRMPQLHVDTIPQSGLHMQEEQPVALVEALLHEVEENRR